MSINREMDKEDVVHIYKGLLPIKKNDIVPFAEMWIDLESVIQSEISRKEKKKLLQVNAYMWNLEKWYRWTYLQDRRNRDTWNLTALC